MESQYYIANNLIDKITGFDINSRISEAIRFDFFNRNKIEEYQKEKFEILARIASKSVYYKDFKNLGHSEFPVMSRENYTTNEKNLMTYVHKPYKQICSSGSTGTPVMCYITKEMLHAKRVSHQKMLRWYGLQRESSDFKLGGLPVGTKTRLYYKLKNKRYFSSFEISDKNLPWIIKVYNDFKPKVISGYPSAIQNFILYSNSKKITLHSPDLIVPHAENLYRDTIDIFQKTFPIAKIANQYWATEANIAETCPHGNLHIDEDTLICEVINKDENGIGDLLVTNLFSYSAPIIRYKIGDRVKLSEKQCPCGRNTKVIESIVGREAEFIELSDGKKFPITAFYFSEEKNILCYQLVYQPKKQKLVFRYTLIDKNKGLDTNHISHLINYKLKLISEFERVDEIHLTEGGKFKRLIIEN